MTHVSSSVKIEEISNEMENMVDSNSESDISDHWAVIDEDSSLEWNNEIKYHFRSPRYNSRNDQSDEESIEVVPEDLDTGTLRKDAEIVPDVTLPPIQKATQNKDNHTENFITHLPDDVAELKNNEITPKHYYPVLIGILTLSIAGIFALGCFWVFHDNKIEHATSVTSARVLVTKLQLENQFLRRQLRSVHSSLRLTVSRPTIMGPYRPNKEIQHFPISTFDFAPNPVTTNENFFRDYYLASDVWNPSNSGMKITNTQKIWKENAEVSVQSRSDCKSNFTNKRTLSKEMLGQTGTQPNSEKDENNTYFHCAKPYSKLNNLGSIRDACHYNKNYLKIPTNEINTSEKNNFKLVDGGVSDSLPYTQYKNKVENIYTLTSLLSNESQTALPPKAQLLNTLTQNMERLDALLNGNSTGNVHNKVTSFKIEIQNTTRTLLDFIDQSINILLQTIADKVKESQHKIQNQFCNLKFDFESDQNIALLDWQGKPIFQDCSTFKESNIIMEHRNEVKKFPSDKSEHDVKGNKTTFTETLSNTNESDQQVNNLMGKYKRKGLYTNTEFKIREKNVIVTEHVSIEGGEQFITSENIDGLSQKAPYKKNLKKTHHSEKHKASFSKWKKGDFKTKNGKNGKRKQKEEEKQQKYKEGKSGSKKSKDQIIQNHDHSDKKKKNRKKDKSFDYENDIKKQKKFRKSFKMSNGVEKGSNISGDWAIKLAGGRAEQRRRDHESDWVFDRAQSRNSNRGKSKSCWFNGQQYNK